MLGDRLVALFDLEDLGETGDRKHLLHERSGSEDHNRQAQPLCVFAVAGYAANGAGGSGGGPAATGKAAFDNLFDS